MHCSSLQAYHSCSKKHWPISDLLMGRSYCYPIEQISTAFLWSEAQLMVFAGNRISLNSWQRKKYPFRDWHRLMQAAMFQLQSGFISDFHDGNHHAKLMRLLFIPNHMLTQHDVAQIFFLANLCVIKHPFWSNVSNLLPRPKEQTRIGPRVS